MPAGWIMVRPGQYWPALSQGAQDLARAVEQMQAGANEAAAESIRTAATFYENQAGALASEESAEFLTSVRALNASAAELERNRSVQIKTTRAITELLEAEALYFPPGPDGQLDRITADIARHLDQAGQELKGERFAAGARRIQMATGLIRYIAATNPGLVGPRLRRSIQDLGLIASTFLDGGWVATREFARVRGRSHTALGIFHGAEQARYTDEKNPDFAAAHLAARRNHWIFALKQIAIEEANDFREDLVGGKDFEPDQIERFLTEHFF